ncbi:hypothetical protein Cme02nite_07380 [Catellatospora methionotrophica]|uniref:Uncharacterized protein n=1 Tax=Catellatospora methionotrophica TaxID=121620 RepID=A0A8J3PCG1_9ACTN|nr:hypothetical protein [Catellatospora methionotrophica]GIG12406.1 hypothetical protein Cme02nite_07380 [Catellatospora methionotrophica]
MPEQMEHEPLAEAFFQFRMQAPDEIVVPGVPVARRTVRRRRTARVSAVAALTALVLAVGGYSATLLGAPAPVQPAVPSASPSPTVFAGPALNADQLRQLGVKALDRLGFTPERLRRGVAFGPVDAAAGGSTHLLGTAAQPLPAGRYTLVAVCRGVGRITVDWRTDDDEGTMDAPCTDPPADGNVDSPAARAEVQLRAPGLITLSVTGDGLARSRAGFAAMVTDPLMAIADYALARPSGDHVGGVSMVIDRTEIDTDPDAKAGIYVLTLTCAGTGTIKATLRVGEAGSTRTVRCSERPSPITITVTAKRAATRKVIFDRRPEDPAVAVAYYLVTR